MEGKSIGKVAKQPSFGHSESIWTTLVRKSALTIAIDDVKAILNQLMDILWYRFMKFVVWANNTQDCYGIYLIDKFMQIYGH